RKFRQRWNGGQFPFGMPGPRRAGRGARVRRGIVGLPAVEAVTAAAEDEFVAGLEQRRADADEGAVGRVEVREYPERSAVAAGPAEFGVAGGHESVVADAEIALGPADDEAVGADANFLSVVAAVVEDDEQGERRPLRGAEVRRLGLRRF